MPSPESLPSDPSLPGRVVIVTGGNRGLGREIYLALLACGAHVAVTSHAGGETLATMEREGQALGNMKQNGGKLLALQGDVADWSDCQRVVAESQARFGPVHVLINNVGRGMRLISETFNTVPIKFWHADVAA